MNFKKLLIMKLIFMVWNRYVNINFYVNTWQNMSIQTFLWVNNI